MDPKDVRRLKKLAGAERPKWVRLAGNLSNYDTDKKLVEKARKQYAEPSSNDVEVDDDAAISRADDGTWVQAWLWLAEPGQRG